MSSVSEKLVALGYRHNTAILLEKTLEMREKTVKGLLSSKSDDDIINTLGNFSSMMAKALISSCLDPAVDTDSREDGTDIGDAEVIASVVTPILFEVCLMMYMMSDGSFDDTKRVVFEIVNECLKECKIVVEEMNKLQGTSTDGKGKPPILN